MRKSKIVAALTLSAVLFAGSVNAGQRRSSHSSTLAAKRFAKTAQAGGKTYTHQKSGIQFDLPAGWQAEPDGDDITISSADDALTVIFWVPEEGTFETAVEAIYDEIGKIVKKVKMDGKGKEGTHNGMAYFSASGTGEVEEIPVHWSIDLLQAKKPLIILTFAASELFEKHLGNYKKLIASIKRTE